MAGMVIRASSAVGIFPSGQAVGSVFMSGGASTSGDMTLRIPRANGTAADVGGAGTEFTIDFWIRAVLSGFESQTIAEGPNYVNEATDGNIIIDSDGALRGFITGVSNGRLYLGINNGSSGRTLIGTSDLISDEGWHHVAVYRNATSGLMQVFADGNREDSITGPTGNIAHGGPATGTDGFHVLGKEKLNITFGFRGWVSELRFSTNQRYTGTTYTVPTAPYTTDGNTALLYHFDENTGSTANDVSGNNIDCELLNSATWSTEDPF